jgi:carboxyl-terminal processing protease
MVLAWLVLPAFAGDAPLYEHAAGLMRDFYLYPERLDERRMFLAAGHRLEDRVEWLLVEEDQDSLHLRRGDGRWHATVPLRSSLPSALAQLEDAVRSAGLPAPAEEDVRVALLRGMVDGLDRYTTILHGEGLDRFDERLSGSVDGIGVTLAVEGGRIVVREVLAGAPAARAGVLVGDQILTIDGISTLGMSTSDASVRVRGEPGTTLMLMLSRAGATLEVEVIRASLQVPNVRASAGPRGSGVITIEHFSEQTWSALTAALGELAAMDRLRGVVLDLRGNSGGSLLQSARAADAFVDEGTILTTSGRDGRRVANLVPKVEAHADLPAYGMPLAVLVDEDTASGAEILAGALAALDRAVIVGAPTFGKGVVQTLYTLRDGLKLKMTSARWLLDGGVSVTGSGLAPDLPLARVRFGASGSWYADPAKDPTAVRWADVEDADPALEWAARLVGEAQGGSRGELLAALDRIRGDVAAEADRGVVAAFAARGVDWSDAPGAVSGPPAVTVRIEAEARAGQTTIASAIVRNVGPTPLHRVSVRLRSVNAVWEDLVLAVGRLEPGQSGTGQARVTAPWGAAGREDVVAVVVEQASGPSAEVEPARLVTVGAARPEVSVDVRIQASRLHVAVRNESALPIAPLTVRVPFPDGDAVALVDADRAELALPAKHLGRASIGLRLTAGGAASVPLRLLLDGGEYGLLARFDLDVPTDGRSVHLHAPSVVAVVPGRAAAGGWTTLRVRASDDDLLDHLVVRAGQEVVDRSHREPRITVEDRKVAWRRGSARRQEWQLRVPVREGTNRYLVSVTDRDGLETQKEAYVLGVPADEATAENEGG